VHDGKSPHETRRFDTKIVMTGGAGFLGWRLARRLLDKGTAPSGYFP